MPEFSGPTPRSTQALGANVFSDGRRAWSATRTHQQFSTSNGERAWLPPSYRPDRAPTNGHEAIEVWTVRGLQLAEMPAHTGPPLLLHGAGRAPASASAGPSTSSSTESWKPAVAGTGLFVRSEEPNLATQAPFPNLASHAWAAGVAQRVKVS